MSRCRRDRRETPRDERQSRRSGHSNSRHPSTPESTGESRDQTRGSNRRQRSSKPATGTQNHGRITLAVSGIFILFATKFADALTTGIGLAYAPGVYEANPIARPVFGRIGVAEGLLFSSFVVVVAIVAVTEIAALAVARRRRDGHLAPVVRAVGYGLPSLLFAAVAVRNAAVLVEAVEALAPL